MKKVFNKQNRVSETGGCILWILGAALCMASWAFLIRNVVSNELSLICDMALIFFTIISTALVLCTLVFACVTLATICRERGKENAANSIEGFYLGIILLSPIYMPLLAGMLLGIISA